MIMPMSSKTRAWALLATFFVVAGCAGSDVLTRHYVIDAPDQRRQVQPASAQNGPIIAVAPVTLPDYLNQSGIVTREPGNEITRAEFHLWAGPLAEEIARAVAENLSAILPTDRVTLAVGRRSIPIDYLVDIEIVKFERDPNNVVQLVARWTLFRGDEKALLAMRRSQFQAAAAGPEYDATVAAMSQAVVGLSEEIAAAIRQGRRPARSDRWAAERTSRSPSGEPPAGAPSRRR
jgi:uncharacterized lipoprotein YmbA